MTTWACGSPVYALERQSHGASSSREGCISWTGASISGDKPEDVLRLKRASQAENGPVLGAVLLSDADAMGDRWCCSDMW